MLRLYFNIADQPHTDAIIERLEEMSLAHELLTRESDDPFQLTDGNLTFVGTDAIHHHLDMIQEELHRWYYCNC